MAVEYEEAETPVSSGSRLLFEESPPPQGETFLPGPFFRKSPMMCVAKKNHIMSGYAAVGDVAKPPPGRLPVIWVL